MDIGSNVGTFGVLMDENNEVVCKTLEYSPVPKGNYRCENLLGVTGSVITNILNMETRLITSVEHSSFNNHGIFIGLGQINNCLTRGTEAYTLFRALVVNGLMIEIKNE